MNIVHVEKPQKKMSVPGKLHFKESCLNNRHINRYCSTVCNVCVKKFNVLFVISSPIPVGI